MKYLLLIPASISMVASVFFYLLFLMYQWNVRRHVVIFVAAVCFQFGGILIASSIR